MPLSCSPFLSALLLSSPNGQQNKPPTLLTSTQQVADLRFQNGLAIAGDYMSAASFLGISAMVFSSGFDGLLYSLGFMVGWLIVLFLVAERLRNR